MEIIKPRVEHFAETPTDLDGCLKLIEKCGRTCYNSLDKITETSAKEFVEMLLLRNHTAMLEHSNFIMEVGEDVWSNFRGKYHLKYRDHINEKCYIGGNYRAWLEYFQFTDLNYFSCECEVIPKEIKRYTAKFICDRGVSHELVRHRPASFAQRSTRYCDESIGGMKFIEPWWYEKENAIRNQKFLFEVSCREAEWNYNKGKELGMPNQAARAMLPNSLMTEIWVTADAKEWQLIRKLRTDKAAHPDIVRLMNLVPWDIIEEF